MALGGRSKDHDMASLDSIVKKLSGDPKVWARVRNEIEGAADPKARFIELAREEGLDVDVAELDGTLARVRELSESDLESVSGGVGSLSLTTNSTEAILIGLLLPAVQKVR